MNKISKYFPERFVNNRHYAKKMLKIFNNSDFDPDYSQSRNGDFDLLREFIRKPVREWQEGAHLPYEMLKERDEILKRLQKDNYKLPDNPTDEDYNKWNEHVSKKMQSDVWKEWTEWLEKAKKTIIVHRKLEQETIISRDIIRFYQSGRNIFEISIFLRNLLEKTDVGNIQFKDFKLPYKTIYFHFGIIKDIKYPIYDYEEKFDFYFVDMHNFETVEEEDEFYDKKNFYLEGAFVSITRENTVDIQLCFIDPNDNFQDKINIVNDHRFPTFTFTLSFEKWDNNTKKHIYDDEITFNESVVIFSDMWDSEDVTGEIKYEKLNRLTKEPEKCSDDEWKEFVLIDKSLKLIVNSISYISSYNDDVEIFATDEQANEILEKLHKTNKKQLKNKLSDKLSKFSYSKVHFLGHKLKKYIQSQTTDIELEPHWRRGHWSRQVYGKNLSKRKLIWIKPTLVRKDKGNPQKGHIYDL